MNLKSDLTFHLGADFEDITKGIKAFSKKTEKTLTDSMKLGLEKSIQRFKQDLKGLKNPINATPEEFKRVQEMAKRIKDATKVKLELDISQANKTIDGLRYQILGTYVAFKKLVSKPISASIDFNNAINEINAFANLGAKELESLKKDIWDLGKNNGVSLEGILKTTELSSQLGVVKNELKDFSQLALNLQVGLKLSSEESVNGLSKISKAFGMHTKDLEIFGDTLTQMGLTTKTSAKAILEVTKSILSGAKAFGLSAKETSALSSAFLSVGLDSSEASSSINKFFTELNNIDNATPAFTQALSQMGLDAEQLKEDIQNNPQEAIKNLFADLNDLDDAERFGVISELFGKKMANNINSAKDGIQAFQKALESSKDSAGALQKAVDRVAGDGFGDLVISLGTAFKHLGVSIGNGFVPILKPVFEGIKSITNALSGFLDNHKWLGVTIASVITGLTLTKTLLLSVKLGVSLFSLAMYPLQAQYKMLTNKVMFFNIGLKLHSIRLKTSILFTRLYDLSLNGLKKSLKGLSGAFKLSITWIRAFSVALLTTPVGWLGLALGVVAYGIYKLWKPIKTFFGGFFEGLTEGLAPIIHAFSSLWTAIKTAFAPVANLLGAIFGEMFSQIDSTQEGLSGFAKVGFTIGKLIGGAISIVAKPFEWLMQIITLALEGVAQATNWLENSTFGKWILGDDNKAIDVNKTTNLKGSIDEVITKQNENKAKMLSSLQNNQTDNSRQINDYKTITINTNANPQAIASAINSYSYADDEF